MISDTVCMAQSYAFRNLSAREKVTNSVIADDAAQPQKSAMLDHEAIRDELIRQLDTGEIKAVTVAAVLGIAKSRIVEMRKRDRRVQQHEMQPLARLLGLMPDQPETVAMPVALPSAKALIQMFEGLFEAVDRPDLADELAPRLAQHFPTALRRTLDRSPDQVVDEPAPPVADELLPSKGRRARQ